MEPGSPAVPVLVPEKEKIPGRTVFMLPGRLRSRKALDRRTSYGSAFDSGDRNSGITGVIRRSRGMFPYAYRTQQEEEAKRTRSVAMRDKELEIRIEDARQRLDRAITEKRGMQTIMGLSLVLDRLIEEHICIDQKNAELAA